MKNGDFFPKGCKGTRFDQDDSASWSWRAAASCAMVLICARAGKGTVKSNSASISPTNLKANRECPPSSKKSSWMPTG